MMPEKGIADLEDLIKNNRYDAVTLRNHLRDRLFVPHVVGIRSDIWESRTKDLLVLLDWCHKEDCCVKYRIYSMQLHREGKLEI